nr:hypothetical protein [Actinosynnema mirum]
MTWVLVVLLALSAGCWRESAGVRVEFDETLGTAILDLAHSDGVRPLKELAPGDWTTVRVLIGPALGERVAAELGVAEGLEGDGTYRGGYAQDGNLLAFRRGDEVARVVGLGRLAVLGAGEYPADVVLRARDGAITMTDPAGRPVGSR